MCVCGQTDRQTDSQTDRQRKRERGREGGREGGRERGRQTGQSVGCNSSFSKKGFLVEVEDGEDLPLLPPPRHARPLLTLAPSLSRRGLALFGNDLATLPPNSFAGLGSLTT